MAIDRERQRSPADWLPAPRPLRLWPWAVPAIIRAHPLAAILLAALAVRIALAPLTAHLPGGHTDEGYWIHWMSVIDREGILNIFRASDTDYVGYHWVLWPLTWVYSLSGGPYSEDELSLHLLVKVPPILFDLLLILTVFLATRTVLSRDGVSPERAREAALLGSAIIAFQPAVLYDSAVWSQTDSAITAAMLGAIVLAAVNRPFASGAALALGIALKPHPVIIGPAILILLWQAGGLRAVWRAAAGGVLVAAIVLGPWILHGDLGRILDIYHLLFTQERERLSELAWNFWWVLGQQGDPHPNDRIAGLPLSFKQAGLALSALSAGLAAIYAWRRPGLHGALLGAAYLAFAFYAWPIGSHDRYLFPFLGLLLPVVLLDRRWVWLYAAVSTTFFLNLFIVAPPVPAWMDRWVYSDFGVAVAVANTALFAAFTGLLLLDLWRGRVTAPASVRAATASWARPGTASLRPSEEISSGQR
jgi:dolichyl-phosphate-mannose-protein mannosyltransferase